MHPLGRTLHQVRPMSLKQRGTEGQEGLWVVTLVTSADRFCYRLWERFEWQKYIVKIKDKLFNLSNVSCQIALAVGSYESPTSTDAAPCQVIQKTCLADCQMHTEE